MYMIPNLIGYQKMIREKLMEQKKKIITCSVYLVLSEIFV